MNRDNYIIDNNCFPYGYPSVDNINMLDGKDEIFVFGSNLDGRHGKGAALQAMKFGAKYGVGVGIQGNTYAIPTKDKELKVMFLKDISRYVKEFIKFASANPQIHFLVTKIGCGLAGYNESDIAPMFKDCKWQTNIHLPYTFIQYLKQRNL